MGEKGTLADISSIPCVPDCTLLAAVNDTHRWDSIAFGRLEELRPEVILQRDFPAVIE